MNAMTMRAALCVAAATLIGSATGPVLAQSGEVNVYTYREQKLIQPLFDAAYDVYRNADPAWWGGVAQQLAHGR